MSVKTVKVTPSETQLSKGAKALEYWLPSDRLMSRLSAKEKRIVAKEIYTAMVGKPHNAVPVVK